MFGLFNSPPFTDLQLGELRRSGGKWRGTIHLGDVPVPLVLHGSRSAPDAQALEVAHSIPASISLWRPAIQRALFEHYEPYAESVAAGEDEAPSSGMPAIDRPEGVWPHTNAEYVLIAPLDGLLTVEIGYRVAWDEEHTLGARLRDGKLLELNGSVLAP
ncbi:MAG TPA: hypothetical protein VIP11_11880 [Gemmatimonadaceae bacterium]